ncbi:uncharacterized protein K02A2.6-like [Liolophura sinensis]|uniref:uncharacterized protein K02A2.6-like n=1 Tax=Liolophura sinensis TaxID=3198878 RepID=UPI003158A9C6
MPDKPWSHVSADFCGPFLNGDYLLVVIDDYSHNPEDEVVKSTSAAHAFPKFDRIFFKHGIVDVLKTHNGPSFNGNEFTKFAEIQGFKLLTGPEQTARRNALCGPWKRLFDRYDDLNIPSGPNQQDIPKRFPCFPVRVSV